jgi:putative hemolysin
LTEGNIVAALLLTIILVTINGMLAGAELAMLGLHEGKLRALVEQGDKKARLLLHMKQHPSRFLSTLQIGITLAGLLSGAFAADTLATPLVSLAIQRGAEGLTLSLIQGASTFLVTLLMTFFMLVFGELVPKRIAMTKPDAVAYRVITPIYFFSKLATPLVRLLSSSTNRVLTLLGIDPKHEEPITEEDVLLMLKEGEQQGKIKAVEVQVMSNLFEFTDLRVTDAMTHRTKLHVLPQDGTLAKAVQTMSETGLNKFPVVDGTVDRIVGILYSKDIAAHILEPDAASRSIKDFMRPAYFVPEGKLLMELFGEMKRSKDRLAVVVDEYGGTSGIITLMNIIEEIVGDLSQSSIPLITEMEEEAGAYLIDGRIEVEDLAAFFQLRHMPNEADTFSGFLIHRLGYVPQSGQHPEVSFCGYVARVEEVERGFIRRATLRKKA